ncbi:MAG TPA: V-type ATPase 116kDa subunit family protein, partial [bacterium]|nr:V-type ATPase 116kDa subunit family protein [bacterium]
MFLAEPMSELSVVFLQQDEAQIIKLASESGVLHMIEPQLMHTWTKELHGEDIAVVERQYGAISAKARSLLQDMGKLIPLPTHLPPESLKNPDELQKSLNEISAPVRKIQARLESLNTEKSQLDLLSRQLHSPRAGEIAEAFAGPHSFLKVSFASGREANLATLQSRLEGVPSVVMPLSVEDERVTILAMVLRRDRVALDKALQAAGFEAEDPSRLVPQHEISLEKLQDKRTEIEQELASQRTDLEKWAAENTERAIQIFYQARRGEMAAKARSFVRATRHARFLCGWVPTGKGRSLIREIQQSTQGRAFTELVSADQVEGVRTRRADVPALFRNPGWMRPFEPLTTGFGIPTYRSVNPTPFLAVTFLFMFGMMFGDVGHGLVLALGGWFLSRRNATRNLGFVLLMAGASSILFGMFYGSVFGLEHVIPAMVLHPMEEIETLALIAIVFGVLMISLGVILRIINASREGNWADVAFDKSGLISG